ncbi:MAG TPA: ABC transporter permease, partial [Gammaproteobacteria bacterium]
GRRTHEAHGDSLVTAIWEDVRHALRAFARAPRFAAVAVATLAIGIGANTAMFSVVNALLLKKLPFAEPDSLMLVHLLRAERNAGPGAYREMVWSYPRYRRFIEEQDAFESYALFSGRDFNLGGDGSPQRVRGEVISDRYAAVLGANPIAGREFTFEEANTEGAPAVAMIGHALWASRYAADPDIIGRSIQVNEAPYTVVGVLPPGFAGMNGNAQLWVPIAAVEPSQLAEPFSHSYSLIARRKPGVSAEAAVANTRLAGDRVGAELRDPDPDGQAAPPNSATAASLSASRADTDVRRASLILLGAVGFLLLIACVNLTNLLVARAIERRREVAIRTVLGATPGRIGRQFFVESILLAGAGALAGLALAPLLLAAAATLLPDSDTLFRTALAPGARRIAGAMGLTQVSARMIGLDTATLLFTFGVTAVTAALVAVVPALQALAARPVDALKASGAAATRGRRALMRSVPIVAQIALSLVLLIGAGLMIRSAVALHGTPLGVDPSDLLTVQLELPSATYGETPDSDRGSAFYSQLVERVRALPGVESVGMASFTPVGGAYNQTRITFLQPPRDGAPTVGVHWVTPDYFPTLGVPLLQGRSFLDTDRRGAAKAVLINAAAARAMWPDESPIGKTIAVHQGGFWDGAEIVGVVADVRYGAIESAPRPDVYLPLAQSFRSRMQLFVHSALPAQALATSIANEVRLLDPNLPLAGVKTMDARVGEAMWRTRVGAWALSAFGALALLLTAVGIFGVMAQAVAQRTTEIGVRMALGAQARDVLGWMLRRAMLVTGVGIALGVACALGVTRLIGALLYDVPPHDPVTFVAVALLLGAVAFGACYWPVRRATRVDVLVALKND